MAYTPSSSPSSEKLSFDKLKELDALFDEQLKGTGKQEKSRKSTGKSFSLKKIVAALSALIVMLLLPFLVLIRSSVYLYTHYSLNGWLALSIGVGITILLLLLYAAAVSLFIGQSARVHKYLRRGIALLVIAYCSYGLLYFSGVNAKSEEVSSYYLSLHPILRVSMATTILLHNDLIVTDMQRNPGDYAAMGLPVNSQSLHYEQKTGYVHAADIRTKGRAEWKNWITEQTFALFGLNTLRHVGTADHLHISLPLND
ncbi:hypothetical protein G3570_00815 [Balneolaceae bacterium YR4-1]|uniref:Uncharacterized protein n=1 Tax=Halalkalibaculum roseum TaxID=2709311 RepID=A0A6M1SSK7_9BACT|nr:hypothetical protein [Halalkalibaculum roseum]NGP75156.1 hypothetical protein [Halalkalibaculum roseum]